MLLYIVLIQSDAGGFDCQLATIGHGIARIGGKVHYYLFNLHRVRAHTANISAGYNVEMNVLSNQARQHFADFLEHLVQI